MKTAIEMGLSAANLKALRRCYAFQVAIVLGDGDDDNVYARVRVMDETLGEVARFEVDTFVTDYDQERSISVDASRFRTNQMIRRYDGQPNLANTFVRSLKAGDRIVFRWVRNNNSEDMKDAGIVRDELHVHVYHVGSTDPFCFVLDTYVGLANRSARMIQG